VLAAFDAAGQGGPAPADVASDAIFEAPVVGESSNPSHRINAGVLAPLFEERGEARVVMTRRSADLRTHQGQVSFPGGRLNEGEDASTAALREAHEEVGLDPALVTSVGWLHPVLTMVSASFILPLVGTLAERPRLAPNPGEVERIFDVSLAELADPDIFHEERWRIPGRVIAGSEDNSFPLWFFEVSGELIWGATARMLYELLSIVLVGRSAT
jgi:8-oxo-dGTP pyrophosphatase MutT (NUDIX family)